MDEKITLYAYTFASRADRVRWALNELGLDYEYIELDPFKGETSTEDYLKLNPQKKLPLLTHGDNVFSDSLAIIEYLIKLVPDCGFIPEGAQDYYRMRHIIYYCLTEVEAYLWTADQQVRLHFLYQWPEGTSDEARARVIKALPLIYNNLEQFSFAAGDAFTLADFYIFQILLWSNRTGIEHPEPVLKYIERMRARPAFPEIKDMLNPDAYN